MRRTFDPHEVQDGSTDAREPAADTVAEARRAYHDAIAEFGVDSGEALAAMLHQAWVARRRGG